MLVILKYTTCSLRRNYERSSKRVIIVFYPVFTLQNYDNSNVISINITPQKKNHQNNNFLEIYQ